MKRKNDTQLIEEAYASIYNEELHPNSKIMFDKNSLFIFIWPESWIDSEVHATVFDLYMYKDVWDHFYSGVDFHHDSIFNQDEAELAAQTAGQELSPKLANFALFIMEDDKTAEIETYWDATITMGIDLQYKSNIFQDDGKEKYIKVNPRKGREDLSGYDDIDALFYNVLHRYFPDIKEANINFQGLPILDPLSNR
jgi:hypothetical protein